MARNRGRDPDGLLTHGVSKRSAAAPALRDGRARRSTLLAGLRVPRQDDERLRNTVLAVAEELTRTASSCVTVLTRLTTGSRARKGRSCLLVWLVSAFATWERCNAPADLMERLLRIASPLGLYAEEYDRRRGGTSKLPQAFSISR